MNEAKFSGRRVVTRMNEQGRSIIGLDGPPAETIEFSLGGGLQEIWTDLAGPLDPKSLAYLGAGPVRLGPPSGGVQVRWFTVAPSPVGVPQEEIEKRVAEAFHSIGGDRGRPDVSKGPAMHLTSTLDVIVLIMEACGWFSMTTKPCCAPAMLSFSGAPITPGYAMDPNPRFSWLC